MMCRRFSAGTSGLQPGQKAGHILARERAGLLAVVLARVKIVGQVSQPANVALRGLRP